MAIVDVSKFSKRVQELEALRRMALDEIDELEADVGRPYEPDSNEIRNAGYVKIPEQAPVHPKEKRADPLSAVSQKQARIIEEHFRNDLRKEESEGIMQIASTLGGEKQV